MQEKNSLEGPFENMPEEDKNRLIVLDCHAFRCGRAPALLRNRYIKLGRSIETVLKTSFDEEKKAFAEGLQGLVNQIKNRPNLAWETFGATRSARFLNLPVRVEYYLVGEKLCEGRKGSFSLPADLNGGLAVILNDTNPRSCYGATLANVLNQNRQACGEGRSPPVLAPYAFLAATGGSVCPACFERPFSPKQLRAALTNESFVTTARDAIFYDLSSPLLILEARSRKPSGPKPG